jgi:dTMP kinase
MFITIDGPDGVGKTTLAHLLVKKLAPRPAVYTSEPTKSRLGQKIRRILKSGNAEELAGLTRLFLKDRAQHLCNFILPQLRRGKIVVCDRYKYSTIVYQSLQGESTQELIALNQAFQKPDLAFILYTDRVDVLVERVNRRRKGTDLFETRETIEKTIALYRNMPQYYPDENIVMICADQSMDAIVDEMLTAIMEHASK